jgi:hypothetical protein
VIRSICDDYQKIETDRHDVHKTTKLVTKRLESIQDLDLTLGIQTNTIFKNNSNLEISYGCEF